MGMEVERKFIVDSDAWREHVTDAVHIVQGYLTQPGNAQPGMATVRVRTKGDRAFLTIKGPSRGIARTEFEYEIPVADARSMLDELAQGPVVDKVRHLVPVGDHVWEVDVFAGANAPLVMAEVELAGPAEPFAMPAWAGRDVSDDPRFYNANLSRVPYSTWGTEG
ncbi:MAG: CYTH domain-containing protein [Candidatus Nanopelagicales bacterium]|jgi:adenylate cyclase|nr:CYTH domain-containing protein [Candidatus Nanopelagicales bacterium]